MFIFFPLSQDFFFSLVVLTWLSLCFVKIWISSFGLWFFFFHNLMRLNSTTQQLFVAYADVWSQWIFLSSVMCAKFDASIPTALTLLWIHGRALTAKICKGCYLSAVESSFPLVHGSFTEWLSLSLEVDLRVGKLGVIEVKK